MFWESGKMDFDLREFSIHGLHGVRTLRIPISDGKLILVGINGLGKTTVTTILYRVLSRQWAKLLDFRFDYLTLRFSDVEQIISRADIESSILNWTRIRRLLPGYALGRLRKNPELISQLLSSGRSGNEIFRLSEELEVSPAAIERILSLPMQSQRELFELERQQDEQDKPVVALSDYLSKHVTQQILYLPTYRRIEKDLKTIFPKLEEQVRRFHRSEEQGDKPSLQYVELVEFGMEDVAAKFESTITALKETARAELNAVVGTYLREVIRGEARVEDVPKIQRLDDNTIARALNRVEERTLSQDEKTRLRDLIFQIKLKAGKSLSVEDAYIARFFSKLVTLDQVLSARESSIKSFVGVCQGYLHGKAFTYDEQNYRIHLQLDSGRPMDLRDLSSGEKQIVSLFAHLYLEQQKSFVVIIDEPELSLSVDWQRKLLPDIVQSGRCSFLAAATHSPYVIDNELEPYAQDLAESVEVVEG
nr:AAA family ATPase [Myxococcus xanthus]